MRSPTDNRLSSRQAAALVGVGLNYILKAIRGGALRAQVLPVGDAKTKRRYRIDRADLATWMVRSGIDPRVVRQHLNRPEVVALVKCSAKLQGALAGTPTVSCPTFFHLGRVVRQGGCWATVINLPATSNEDAIAALREYAREPYRPELIGLHGDDLDAGTRRALAEVFDCLLPACLDPAAQARAVLQLSPSREGRLDTAAAGRR